MLKINIAIPETIKARINERDVKSKAKRNLKLDQIRCVSKQPIIEMSKKRPLASLESLGKRTKKTDLSYVEKTDVEDEETFRVDVARDIRRQEEKECRKEMKKTKPKCLLKI